MKDLEDGRYAVSLVGIEHSGVARGVTKRVEEGAKAAPHGAFVNDVERSAIGPGQINEVAAVEDEMIAMIDREPPETVVHGSGVLLSTGPPLARPRCRWRILPACVIRGARPSPGRSSAPPHTPPIPRATGAPEPMAAKNASATALFSIESP